jgi:hypothetical protein
MTKTITVGVPDDLGKRMEKLNEVNWSAVTRDCIEQYVVGREKPELKDILEKLRKEKGDEYAKGVKAAKERAKSVSYAQLEPAWMSFVRRLGSEQEKAIKRGGANSDVDDIKLFEEEFREIGRFVSPVGNTSEYLQGYKDTIQEIIGAV